MRRSQGTPRRGWRTSSELETRSSWKNGERSTISLRIVDGWWLMVDDDDEEEESFCCYYHHSYDQQCPSGKILAGLVWYIIYHHLGLSGSHGDITGISRTAGHVPNPPKVPHQYLSQCSLELIVLIGVHASPLWTVDEDTPWSCENWICLKMGNTSKWKFGMEKIMMNHQTSIDKPMCTSRQEIHQSRI